MLFSSITFWSYCITPKEKLLLPHSAAIRSKMALPMGRANSDDWLRVKHAHFLYCLSRNERSVLASS